MSEWGPLFVFILVLVFVLVFAFRAKPFFEDLRAFIEHPNAVIRQRVLRALSPDEALSLVEVAARIDREVDDASVYMTLNLLAVDGLVSKETRPIISADRRHREIGFYTLTAAGQAEVSR